MFNVSCERLLLNKYILLFIIMSLNYDVIHWLIWNCFFFTYLDQNQCDHTWHCIQKTVDNGKHDINVRTKMIHPCERFLRNVARRARYYWSLFLAYAFNVTRHKYIYNCIIVVLQCCNSNSILVFVHDNCCVVVIWCCKFTNNYIKELKKLHENSKLI